MGGVLGKDGKISKDYFKSQMKKFDYEEIKMLQKIYKELASRSNDDGIDKETFLQYFTLPGLWGERLFRKFDIKGKLMNNTGSGHVDFDDFLLSISICCRGTKADKIAVLYQVFDLNEDGLIQKSEIVAMLSNLPNLENYIQYQPKYFITHDDLTDEEYINDSNPLYNKGFQSILPTFSYLDNIPSDTDSSYTLTSDSGSCNEDYAEDGQFIPTDDVEIPPVDIKSPESPKANQGKLRGGHSKIYDSLMALHFKQGEYDYSMGLGSGCKDSSISGMSRTIPDNDMEDGTPMDMDDLVEKLLESCEFSENNSLNLLEFKAWIEKNEYIIHMFSECLHEEVWGLQGNAFHLSNRMSPVFKIQPTPSNDPQIDLPVENSPSFHIDSQMSTADYIKIKNLFVIDIIQSYGLNAIDRSKRVVSEEIVEHMKTRMNKNVEIPTHYTKKNYPMCMNEYDGFHRDVDLLSCPSCKTPYLLCFKCHSRYRSLHLVIYPTQVYIECERCLLHCDPPYTSCWICSWQFDQALNIINSPKSSNSEKDIENLNSSAQSRCGDVNSVDSLPSQMSHRTRDSFGGSIRSVMSTVENALDSGTITVGTINSPNISSNTNINNANPGFKRPIMSGVLYKIGKHLHQWKARYYVLVDNILYYYADKLSTKPRGCIFLEGCYLDIVSERDGTIYDGKYGFSICHKGKKYSRRDLYANSKEKMQSWIDSLTLAMKQQSLTEMYQMCEQLGHGKFSVVFRGIHKQTNLEYAIKIIDKRLITPQERELLRCEMAILRLLRHKNVIFLKDIIDTKDSLYIIMELVRGGELYNYLYSGQRFTEMHTHKIIIQLLETVSYLHKCGIVHRDIKPENILLTDKTPEATIKLTDFGLSTLCGPSEKLTQPCGTLAYVAPEVLTLEGYNHKVDSWSIGVVMFLLIRGRLPFSINHRNTTKPENLQVSFEGSIWDQISSSAKDLIVKLLHPNPENRISVTEALDHIWVKNPTAVIQETPLPRTNQDENNRKTLLQSLDTSGESTFVIQNVANVIKNTSKESNIGSLKGDQQLKEKLGLTLDTVRETESARISTKENEENSDNLLNCDNGASLDD